MTTLERRYHHSSMVVGEKILLMGGSGSRSTTELVPLNGGESVPGVSLQPGRDRHCGIPVAETTVILTGGYSTLSLVTEMSGLGEEEEVVTRELPSLITGRYKHACGSYEEGGRKVILVCCGHSILTLSLQIILVTGGWGGTLLSSTEVLDYSQGGGAWREVGALPSARSGLRGVNLEGIVYISGGWDGSSYYSDILAWNPGTETWSQAGNMKEARSFHTFTEVDLTSVFCHGDGD